MDKIACRGSSVDFASEYPNQIAAAKRICLDCPVRIECLDHGKRRRQTGVYGGIELLVGRPVTP
jgi:WhiB family redox-sensing transcriptional regulator